MGTVRGERYDGGTGSDQAGQGEDVIQPAQPLDAGAGWRDRVDEQDDERGDEGRRDRGHGERVEGLDRAHGRPPMRAPSNARTAGPVTSRRIQGRTPRTATATTRGPVTVTWWTVASPAMTGGGTPGRRPAG